MARVKKINHPNFSPVSERQETSPKGADSKITNKVPLIVKKHHIESNGI